MLLSVAAVFLGLAIVFGAIAFFRITTHANSGKSVPSAVTITVPASAIGTSGVALPSPAITITKYIDMPPPDSGAGIGALETAASTLATVVAAICAVIALRPPGRARPAPAEPPASRPAT